MLGDYRREDYVERRDWAVASDGVQVPLSIIHRADLQVPCTGGDLRLRRLRAVRRPSLLDRPTVAARPRHGVCVAHVRGGGELGRLWYEDGKMLKKKNTFTDFVELGEDI